MSIRSRVFSTFTEDLERGVPQKAAAARIGRPTVNSESRLCQKLCGIALSSVPRAHWAQTCAGQATAHCEMRKISDATCSKASLSCVAVGEYRYSPVGRPEL